MNSKAVTSAIQTLSQGRLLAIYDDLAPTGAGYLVAAASLVSEALIADMVNLGRAVVCAAVSEGRLRELGLPPMTSANKIETGTPDFAISIESRQLVTTGISAADRAQTLRTLALTTAGRRELVTPGHIFPIRTKRGGVLVRADIGEACVDLLEMASLPPVAALTHVLNANGSLASEAEIKILCEKENITKLQMTELIHHRLATEKIVERIAIAHLPTGFSGPGGSAAEFNALGFRSQTDSAEHLVLYKGELAQFDSDGQQKPVLVRVQSENRLGDLLGVGNSQGWQKIHGALRVISETGRGAFVYVRHPRKNLLTDQVLAASNKQLSPLTKSKSPELREYSIGAQILRELGIRRLRLLSTSSSATLPPLQAFGLEIVDRVTFSNLD